MMFNPVKLFIIVAFYIVGAYATTDILRLLRGAQTAVWEKDCYCPACGVRLRLRDQIPVWSFLYGRGKCRGCGGKISFSDIFLEIFLTVSMSFITILLKFSWVGFIICVCLYEATKAYYIIKTGFRKSEPIKNMIWSVGANIFLFSLIAILFWLNNLTANMQAFIPL